MPVTIFQKTDKKTMFNNGYIFLFIYLFNISFFTLKEITCSVYFENTILQRVFIAALNHEVFYIFLVLARK